MMSEKTFEKLTALLVQNQTHYRVVEHSYANRPGGESVGLYFERQRRETNHFGRVAGGSTGGFRQNRGPFWRKESLSI